MSFSMRATRRGHPQCRSMQQMAEADTSCDSDGRLLSSPSPWPVGSLSVGGWRRSAVTSGTTTTAVPRVRSVDGLSLHLHLADRGNQSVYSNGGVGGPLSMNRSFDVNPPTTCYGDDFVETARRLRRSRLNLSNGRTKSAEFGQNGGYLHDLRDSPRLCTTIPPPVAYAGSQTDSGSDLLFGRRSEAYASTGRRNPQEYSLQQRRPQSSFGPRGAVQRFKRFGGHHGSYDICDGEAPSSISDVAHSDEEGDSEGEMARYTLEGRNGGPSDVTDVQTVAGEESYYFGVIHLDQSRVRSILHNFPPPVDYYRLPPIEKAAYLFYVAVYKKLYRDVGDFHLKFNREYYKYTCDGDSDNVALWKICKSMQDEYYSRRLEESQKAYEGSSQQLLLSDVERDNVDDTSERGGIDDNHDGRTSEISSADSIQRAPPKHRVPHAFVTFGPGGKMVTVRPDSSMSLVQIDDIRTVISDPHTVRLIDCAQSFKGPLLIGQTPTNSVRLYIERQIQLLQNLDVLCENTSSNDVTDCLLIWQLLGVIVQQQGRVTGPDLARLLVRASSASSRTSSSTSQNCLFHERGATPSDSTSTASRSVKNVIVKDTSAYERFTELLLGGHITEAIDSAVGDGFFADAMVLARRLLGDDVAKLAEIEERFIATRPQCHPVVTLLSVSSKKPVPIIMNPIGDDSGGWRTHAAIILANLTSSEAMQTVYDLGKALVKHDYNCAADFCFLAVAVLSGVNPFKPDSTSIDQCESRQHISLIHASIPGRYSASLKCRYGFSLADFHATEIFDYAIRLSNISGYSPLGECIEYQRKRIQYAHLIADFGGFTTDAFRYCTEVARAIWNYYHLLPDDVLNDLCDLANRLRYVASANDSEVLWIAHLRSMIEQKKQFHCSEVPQCDFVTSQQLPQASLPVPTDHCVSVNAESTDGGTFRHELSLTPRHAQLQDPVQMSSSASCSSVMSAESEDSRESALRQRFPSSANHHGYNSDEHMIPVDEPQPYATTPPHLEAHLQASVDELSSNSCYTSAQSITEDSITRTSGRQSKDSPIAQHTPLNNFQNITQIPLSSLSAAPVYQPHVHSAQQNISSGQSNGLSDNIKKNDSSHRSKGFLGNLKEKLMKAIPNGDEMILPDDSEPTIVWDPVKGRYVGAGVEEEIRSAPPPIMNISNSQPSFGGLRAARTSGGSRYFNLMNHISSTNDASLLQSSASVPVMQVPTKWCFIPDMPDSERDEAAETTTTERQQQWQQHSTPN